MSFNPKEELKAIKKEKEFFIGIDSDGCVFDTMEIKQKECFCPMVIKHWGLQVVSKYARETWEFVNLYSKTRGCNRFLALLHTMKLLAERKDVQARNAQLPDMAELDAWVEAESKLGNPALEQYVKENPDKKTMKRALDWSLAVNEWIGQMVHGIPPFPFVRESLEKLSSYADAIVVSQTPVEALGREWEEHGIAGFVKLIAGQEYGKKSEHLAYAAKGKYPDDKILMIGDAPGDLKAAKDNGVLFYPINPGHEEGSWERFYRDGLEKFIKGTYAGQYEEMLISEFEGYLPEKPDWE
jgi:phosphoglycolate phosphatase-like HAD superfamily hydrolase